MYDESMPKVAPKVPVETDAIAFAQAQLAGIEDATVQSGLDDDNEVALVVSLPPGVTFNVPQDIEWHVVVDHPNPALMELHQRLELNLRGLELFPDLPMLRSRQNPR